MWTMVFPWVFFLTGGTCVMGSSWDVSGFVLFCAGFVPERSGWGREPPGAMVVSQPYRVRRIVGRSCARYPGARTQSHINCLLKLDVPSRFSWFFGTTSLQVYGDLSNTAREPWSMHWVHLHRDAEQVLAVSTRAAFLMFHVISLFSVTFHLYLSLKSTSSTHSTTSSHPTAHLHHLPSHLP